MKEKNVNSGNVKNVGSEFFPEFFSPSWIINRTFGTHSCDRLGFFWGEGGGGGYLRK